MNAGETTKELDAIEKALLEFAIETYEAKTKQLTGALNRETAGKVKKFGKRIDGLRDELKELFSIPTINLSEEEVERLIERLERVVKGDPFALT